MQVSTISELTLTRDNIEAFGGYNHNVKIDDGEFYDMTNLSSDNYPLISPRGKRGRFFESDGIARILRYDLHREIFAGDHTLEFYADSSYYPGVGTELCGRLKFLDNAEYIIEVFTYSNGSWLRSGRTEVDLGDFGLKEVDGVTYEEGDVIRITGASASINGISYVYDDCIMITFGKSALFWFPSSSTFQLLENIFANTDKKQIVRMAKNTYVFPDNRWIRPYEYNGSQGLGITIMDSDHYASTSTFSLCNIDGDAYTDITVSATAPASPTDGKNWIDTSSSTHILKQWSESNSMWIQVPTTYVKVTLDDSGATQTHSGKNIAEGDAVELTFTGGDVGTITSGTTYYVNKTGDGSIIITGIIDQTSTRTELHVKNKIPKMDYVVEWNNRLWGCRYGENVNGDIVNEIYASKLGDGCNWNVFQGISTDSYAASCGTEGPFTGATVYGGYPLFFKQNCLHKVYGNYPSNFQIEKTDLNGVDEGASGSLCTAGNYLFYKSHKGLCIYDGSLPTNIGSVFGDIEYYGTGAQAGSFGNKYYISMKSKADNKWNLFVYDIEKTMWHREDDLQVDLFYKTNDDLLYVKNGKHNLFTILGSGTQDTDAVEWSCTTGDLALDYIDHKYITRILVRMSLEIGARVMFFIQYDSKGEWEHITTITGNSLKAFSLPIRPKRCDHLRLRIDGSGEAKIYSISKTIKQGSDY